MSEETIFNFTPRCDLRGQEYNNAARERTELRPQEWEHFKSGK